MADTSGEKPELHIKIQTPEGVIWEGEGYSVSSTNSAGPFDILPEHSNMITMIEGASVVVETAREGSKEFKFERTLISMQNNTVSIYADIVAQGNPNLTSK